MVHINIDIKYLNDYWYQVDLPNLNSIKLGRDALYGNVFLFYYVTMQSDIDWIY